MKNTFALQATLSTMKAAKKQGISMQIWEKDIKAVEEAIETIEGIRNQELFKPRTPA